MIPTLILNGVIGALAGLAWAFALGKTLLSGLEYGAIIGVVVGVLLYLFGRAARSGGKVDSKESVAVTGSLSGLLLITSIVTAIIALVIRIIFF